MSMKSKFLNSVANQFPTLRRLKKDKDGIAAIEFAFIAPVMLALYFGMSEVAMGIMADRNVSHAASVTGDLATQMASLDSVELSDIMTATVAVMHIKSSDISDLTIELNSYQMATDGTVTRIGYARMGPTISSGGPATYDPSGLSSDMFNSLSGVVVARINYRYEPVTMKFMNNVTLSETFVMKPRQSMSVPFDEGGLSSFTCNGGTDLTVSCSASGTA